MEDFNILVDKVKEKKGHKYRGADFICLPSLHFLLFKMKIKKNCTFFEYFNVDCIEK